MGKQEEISGDESSRLKNLIFVALEQKRCFQEAVDSAFSLIHLSRIFVGPDGIGLRYLSTAYLAGGILHHFWVFYTLELFLSLKCCPYWHLLLLLYFCRVEISSNCRDCFKEGFERISVVRCESDFIGWKYS
ncbi:MAG: hypothetical protein IPQ04_14370 [Saprospiraceae bacterium]|nr:hypothetical protein [Saprospiraceae bacterium]